MIKRSIFVLTQDADRASCLAEAVGTDWKWCAAKNSQEAKDLIDSQDFLVGMIDFSNHPHDNFLGVQEELMLVNPAISWLAMVPPLLLDNEHFRRHLTTKFFDYHTLPHDSERLRVILGHAHGMARLNPKLYSQRSHLSQCGMIGETEAMQRVYREIFKAASVDYPALVTGESGTGKELVARAIHTSSKRSHQSFVAVNCAALPPNLIQSELFGHEKGAFTGAHESKIGRIEAAQDGTIFLDEIGDLSLEMQVVLLRFLQESVIQRLGSSRDIKLDVRVIAATHVDLDRAVREGRFREDLYYRLNVLRLKLPPLRERMNDVALLAQYFLEKFRGNNIHVKGFSSQAIETILHHNWPGNVRELINRIRRGIVMSENRWLTPADLGLERRLVHRAQVMDLNEARMLAEKYAIMNALRYSGNNLSLSAKNLGISRMTLYRLMEKLGMSYDKSEGGSGPNFPVIRSSLLA